MNDKLEQKLVAQAAEKGIPINAALELSPLCNMNCEMCFIRLSKDEMNAKGRLRTTEEWLSIIKQLPEAGTLFVLLTGGEPLLYEGFKEIYLKLHQMGMIITINTNGTLIDEEMADFFQKYMPRRINITLYGTSDETYNKICHNSKGFTQTMSAIQLLKARGIQVKLNGTITPGNVNEIDRLYEISKEVDVPIEIATYLFPGNRERNKCFNSNARLSFQDAGLACVEESRLSFGEEFRKYCHDVLDDVERYKSRPHELEAEQMGCRGGKSSAWINWQGKMSPCIFMNHVVIDVFENGFRKSWEYIKQKTNEIYLPKKCTNCNLRPACIICPAKCYCETGSFEEAPEYVCEYTKTIVEEMKKIDE